MYIETLLKSLLNLFLMVALGYGIKRFGFISERSVDELSRILLSIILPIAIVSSGLGNESDASFSSVGLSALIISLCYISFFIISFLVVKLAVKDEDKLNVSVNMCVFANTSFIGLPLVNVVFGSEGMIYCVIYNLLYNVFMFTYGITLFEGKKGKTSLKKMFLDPLSIASVLAIVLFFLPIRMPEVIETFIVSVGDLSGPLSMMIVGSWLVGVNFKAIFKRPLSYLVSFLRLLALPLVVYFVLSALGVESVMKNTIVLTSALPVGTLNVIFAKQYGKDARFVNETMMQSLCLSLVTIPLIVLLF